MANLQTQIDNFDFCLLELGLTSKDRLTKAIVCFLSLSAFLSMSMLRSVRAQSIQTDGTTTTILNGNPLLTYCSGSCSIDQGVRSGDNLFHSFKNFNVEAGSTVTFIDPGVTNIFSRVTGETASSIDGTLAISGGSANLFLINASGILFGDHASLNINGSFISTTATAVEFANQGFLSTNPSVNEDLSLLTIQPSAFLFSQNIISPVITRTVSGLNISGNHDLLILGGNLLFEGGSLNASGGRIELGSIYGNSRVALKSGTQGLVFEYENTQMFQDIWLSQAAKINNSEGGSLQIRGRRVILSEGSQISNDTLGSLSARPLTIIASELVELDGVATLGLPLPTGLFASVDLGASGRGGDIVIDTKRFVVRDGAVVSTGTVGNGSGGSLRIRALESIEVLGTGLFSPSLLETSTGLSNGQGGDLVLEAERVIVRDGASIQAITFGAGTGGTLKIASSESVELSGTGATIPIPEVASGLFASSGLAGIPILPTGNSGSLELTTGELIIRDGALAAVNSLGTGDAGALRVNAHSVKLDNHGRLTAAAASGEGGNIRLEIQDVLLLRRNSQVTATAEGGTGDGGNININANFVIAPLNEDNDIIARASLGRGGNIQISATSVYGIEPRPAILGNGTNDIDASSDFGANGLITITQPNLEPVQESSEIPVFLRQSDLVAQECGVDGAYATNEFIITGRGGLPARPEDMIEASVALADLGVVSSQSVPVTNSYPARSLSGVAAPVSLVEAQGWRFDAEGKVVLTASVPDLTAYSPWRSPSGC